MRYLNIFFHIRILHLFKICGFIFFFTSCNTKYEKQFYGTYENIDTSRITFSMIHFYENNKYSFYSSTCFAKTKDSGIFSLTNNKISFRSFELPLLDSSLYQHKSLSKENFLYESGKILYIRHLSPPNKSSYLDTILIGKKTI